MPLVHQLLPYFVVPHTQINSFLMQQPIQDPSMGDINIFCSFASLESSVDLVKEACSPSQG
jgi:hypothetical protein